MTAPILILALLWAASIAVLMRDLDREHAARAKAERQTALQRELREIHAGGRIEDVVKPFHLADAREADRLAWRIRFREAEHLRYVRRFREMWDGTVNIGEDVA